jgi:butyrate kinase
MDKIILVINPGSTSTKLAIYKNGEAYQNTKIQHPAEDLGKFPRIWDQYGFRMDVIKKWIKEHLICRASMLQTSAV